MKRISWFLIVMFAVSCGSTLADITVVEGPTEIPFEFGGVTPSGLVDLVLWDLGSEPSQLVDSEYYGYLGASPLSGSDSYSDAFLDGEVGRWYAEANVDLGENASYGRSIARGLAHFSVDSSQLSLHWNFDATTDQISPSAASSWHAIVWDEAVGYHWYSSSAYPDEGTETLDLTPGGVYTLYWGVDVAVWAESGSYSNATFTLDLTEDIQPIPVPGAIFLGVLGLSVAGLKLRKHA